jgi:hypothetical protein
MPMFKHAEEITRLVLHRTATQTGTDTGAARDVICALQTKYGNLVERGIADFAGNHSCKHRTTACTLWGSQWNDTVISGAAGATHPGVQDMAAVEQVVSECTGSGRHKLVAGAH